MEIPDNIPYGAFSVFACLEHQVIVIIENHPIVNLPIEFHTALIQNLQHLQLNRHLSEKWLMLVSRAGYPVFTAWYE
jgi:hypothetical protein